MAMAACPKAEFRRTSAANSAAGWGNALVQPGGLAPWLGMRLPGNARHVDPQRPGHGADERLAGRGGPDSTLASRLYETWAHGGRDS
jgi:hypothetical protein